MFSGSLQFLPRILKDYQETVDQVFTAEGWGRSQGVRKCHYGQCGNTLGGHVGGLPDLKVFPHLLKYQEFKSISF
jgi:hypothetical protein